MPEVSHTLGTRTHTDTTFEAWVKIKVQDISYYDPVNPIYYQSNNRVFWKLDTANSITTAKENQRFRFVAPNNCNTDDFGPITIPQPFASPLIVTLGESVVHSIPIFTHSTIADYCGAIQY